MNISECKIGDHIILHHKTKAKNITTGYNMFVDSETTLRITKIENNVITAEVITQNQIFSHILEFGPNEYPDTVEVAFGEKS